MKSQSPETVFLSWSIAPGERRKRTRQFLCKAIIPFCIIAFIAATVGYPFMFTDRILRGDFEDVLRDIIWMVGIGVIGVFLLVFLINMVFPYAERRYQLTNTGMRIMKNQKKQEYNWKEFESFSLYAPLAKSEKRPLRLYPTFSGEDTRENLMKIERTIMGSVFYFRKKQTGISRLIKRFVVVYTIPENTKQVRKLLALKLPEKKWTLGEDLGLTFYEFK